MQNMVRILSEKRGYLKRALKIQILKRWPHPLLTIIMGKKMHQQMASIEARFKSKNVTHVLAEYCWPICRDTNPNLYSRQNECPKILQLIEIGFKIHRLLTYSSLLIAPLAKFIPTVSPYCPLHPETYTIANMNHIFFQCPNLSSQIKKFELSLLRANLPRPWSMASVSYTHLTLPTIYSV